MWFVRSPYNYDIDAVSLQTGIEFTDPGVTKQSFVEECDINTLVRRFGITGQLPVNLRAPVYGDFTGVNDFHSAMNAVVEASEAFEQLPADVRYRFHNSPGELVDFCSDSANRAEAIKLGLIFEAPTEPKEAPGSPGEPVKEPPK